MRRGWIAVLLVVVARGAIGQQLACSPSSCTTCELCCRSFITSVATCDACIADQCASPSPPLPTPPPPSPPSPPPPSPDPPPLPSPPMPHPPPRICASISAGCNVCEACCFSYLLANDACSMCVEYECQSPPPSPPPTLLCSSFERHTYKISAMVLWSTAGLGFAGLCIARALYEPGANRVRRLAWFSVAFLATALLLAPIAIVAAVRCAAENASQATWALPGAAIAAACAALLQGQCVGSATFTGWIVGKDRWVDMTEVEQRGAYRRAVPMIACLAISLAISALCTFAFFKATAAASHQQLPFDVPNQLLWPLTPPPPPPPPGVPPTPYPPPHPSPTTVRASDPSIITILVAFIWTASDLPIPVSWEYNSLLVTGSIPVAFALFLCIALRAPCVAVRTAMRQCSHTPAERGCLQRLCARLMAPFKKQFVMQLVLYATIAAFDFTFDVSYVLTQPFAHASLLYVSAALCITPSIFFLIRSGMAVVWLEFTFGTLAKRMCDQAGSYSRWLCKHNKEIMLQSCRRIAEVSSKAWEANSQMYEWNFRKENFRRKLDNPLTGIWVFMRTLGLLIVGSVPTALIVLLLVATISMVIFCGVLSTLIITITVLVMIPVSLVWIGIGWPLVILVWCVVHINFKLSLLPMPTYWLYKCMHAEHMYPRRMESIPGGYPRERHRQINLSFISELLGESLPQFFLVQINEYFVNYSQGKPPTNIGLACAVGSAVAIISLSWGHLYWWCRVGSFDASLSVILLPLSEEDAKLQGNMMRDQLKDDFRDKWKPVLMTPSSRDAMATAASTTAASGSTATTSGSTASGSTAAPGSSGSPGNNFLTPARGISSDLEQAAAAHMLPVPSPLPSPRAPLFPFGFALRDETRWLDA